MKYVLGAKCVRCGKEYEAVPGLTVQVEQASGAKCARCWMYNEHVGEDHDHPELCPRCAAVVKAEQ